MKYKQDIYKAMKPIYEEYLTDKNDENELVEMVDSYEIHDLFKDMCEWHGVSPALVEHLYETFYGKGENAGKYGWFSLDVEQPER